METVVYNWIPSDWRELEISIASVKRYHRNLNKIYVLTEHDLPFEDEQVVRVFMKEEGDTKEKRIINNLKRFCELNICEDFIYMCDDFFVNQPFDSSDIKEVYIEDLEDVIDSSPTNPWDELLYNTYRLMKGYRFPTLNYALHSPSYINCQCFLRTVRLYRDYDYQWESGYFNAWAENPVHIDELDNYSVCFDKKYEKKFIEVTTRNLRFFSVSPDGLTDEMKNFLEEKLQSYINNQ